MRYWFTLLSFIKLYKSHPQFHSSSPSVHAISSSLRLFFSLSSFFLPPICFPLLHLICTFHSLCRASFLFHWPAERVIYYPAETTAQNLKPVRVYIFCVRLFIPYITMHAHASIILSVWFITSWSSGLLRKYGNYNCARLMMHMAPHTRDHFMNNVRATFENAKYYDRCEIVSLDLFIRLFCRSLRTFSLNATRFVIVMSYKPLWKIAFQIRKIDVDKCTRIITLCIYEHLKIL